MDSDEPVSKQRKVRFMPKAPPRGKRKPTTAKPKEEEVDDANAQQLLQRFNELEALRKQRPKAEDKSLIQPTFTYGATQPAPITTFSVPRNGGPNDDSGSETEYKEPWDYNGSDYPTTLPWRRPYSGDPDILDEAEFGEAARESEYDENAINAASELGFQDLDEASDNRRLLFFQLPPSLPLVKRSASAKGKEKEGTSAPPDQSGSTASVTGGRGSYTTAGSSLRNSNLGELSAGHMGKLLVYKSGAVKLKLGDTLYDVSPGSDCSSAQEVVAINVNEKKCCSVGELPKKAVVAPDIDSIFDNFGDLD